MNTRTEKRKPATLLATLIPSFALLLCVAASAQDSVVMVDLPGGVKLDLVWVEGGSFTMGSNDARGVERSYESTRPEHRVSVAGFYMGRFEVTQAQWKAVTDETPAKFGGGMASDSLPVEQVSWEEAQRFVTLLSQMTGHRFRLPSEAEWEFAARGGLRSQGNPYAGCDRARMGAFAWFCANSDGHTHPVGRLKPNELGLYDMSGNVAEWCSDWMSPYSADAQSNPRGPRTGDSRILRGGHYNSTSPACAVFDRGWYVPSGKTEYYGLRVLMEPDVDDND